MVEKYTKQINQKWLADKHSDMSSNCQCDNPSGDTETLRQEGAGDMEICLDCFGAIGCVY